MSDVPSFALTILVICLAGLLAVLSNRFSEWIRIPAPAIFLITAAISSDLVPRLSAISQLTVQRVVTVMLILLLFDGGMHIGWQRFRSAAGAVLWVGVAGTLATTVGIAAVAHLLFGFDWRAALLLGVALAPTDPAVVFSVLGRREIAGRSGTVLEGESGANDPVGIAAMAALLSAGGAQGWTAVGSGAEEFALEMLIGAAAGIGGAYALRWAMQHSPLPSGALYPLRTLLGAGAIYGLASVLHGSGFLAVFVAGILLGDVRAPYKSEIERFHSSLASLAEIVAFTLLGLTVNLGALARGNAWVTGLGLAALLAFVIRPVLVGALLLPISLHRGERLFIMWSGLKGAVPILLGTYIFSAATDAPSAASTDATTLYQVVVVVVAFSVVVQGGLVPTVARLTRVPMRTSQPEPWALGMRFTDEPTGLSRCTVHTGSTADGTSIADLPLSEDTWISMINRDGTLVAVRGSTVLRPGDELLLITDRDSTEDPTVLFRPSTPAEPSTPPNDDLQEQHQPSGPPRES